MKRAQPALFDEKLLPGEAAKLKAKIRKRIAKLKRRQRPTAPRHIAVCVPCKWRSTSYVDPEESRDYWCQKHACAIEFHRVEGMSDAEIAAIGSEAIRRIADSLGGPGFDGAPAPGLVVTVCDRRGEP